MSNIMDMRNRANSGHEAPVQHEVTANPSEETGKKIGFLQKHFRNISAGLGIGIAGMGAYQMTEGKAAAAKNNPNVMLIEASKAIEECRAEMRKLDDQAVRDENMKPEERLRRVTALEKRVLDLQARIQSVNPTYAKALQNVRWLMGDTERIFRRAENSAREP
jgi:hypothetical protein